MERDSHKGKDALIHLQGFLFGGGGFRFPAKYELLQSIKV